MLVELRISNLATIKEQRVSFAAGLNVMSGETGTGKSIILHALELLLGGKPRPHIVRDGESEALVEALFELPQNENQKPSNEDSQLLVQRIVSSQGKSRCLINGKLATIAMLSEITSGVITLCTQNEHVQLLKPEFHGACVDLYGGLQSQLQAFSEQYAQVKNLREKFAEYTSKDQSLKDETERLQEDITELRAISPRPGLKQEIELELKRQNNAESLRHLSAQADASLSPDGELLELFHKALAVVVDIERLDPSFELGAKLREVREAIREAQLQISDYQAALEVDEEGLEKLRDKKDLMSRLERKHKTDADSFPSLLFGFEQRLAALQGVDLKSEQVALQIAEQKLLQLGGALSQARQAAAAMLEKEVEKELSDINLPGAKFQVSWQKFDAPREQGLESARFLLATNSGSQPHPLQHIASGGELSRILLVLKKVLRDRSGVNVLVFDEVDSGISGSVARAVGEKLKSLAQQSQVICITHLAQVASLADHHLIVRKLKAEKSVAGLDSGPEALPETTVELISGKKRIEEIARMLAGYEVTPAARASAKELLSSK